VPSDVTSELDAGLNTIEQWFPESEATMKHQGLVFWLIFLQVSLAKAIEISGKIVSCSG